MTEEANISCIQEQPPAHRGWIFDIQRFSVHDGPGIRTTIFFQGCPLSCLWCSNPESLDPKPQVLYFTQLCKGCAACVQACPQKAISTATDAIHYNRERCVNCGACARVCLYEARILSGRQVTVGDICEVVSKDWRYYMQSGGGVTCGGGEALMQSEFLSALLTRLHNDLGYHTCLDTSGFAPWKVFETLLPYLDLVLMDIKHMDSVVHKKLTGVDNRLILKNARELAKRDFPVLVRLPLITGENDDEAHIHTLGKFLHENCLCDVELMTYHTYGLNKYRALGIEYPLSERDKPDADGCKAILESYGLRVEVRQ